MHQFTVEDILALEPCERYDHFMWNVCLTGCPCKGKMNVLDS